MQTKSEIKSLLEIAGLSPRKSLGQNFLTDKNLITKLIDASGVGPGDLVVEVGPGTGTLTEALLERGCQVIACELDRGLAELNRQRIPTLPLDGPNPGEYARRFTLIEGDCLGPKRSINADLADAIGQRPFALVANLPYAAATPLIISLLIDYPMLACHTMAVTIQREVAERLIAPPGSEAYGALGIVAQAMAETKIIAKLPPECFWPAPDVTSAMVLLRRRAEPATADGRGLMLLCQRLFAARRKQLGAILGRATPLPPGIDPMARPEQLTIEQIVELQRTLPPHTTPPTPSPPPAAGSDDSLP